MKLLHFDFDAIHSNTVIKSFICLTVLKSFTLFYFDVINSYIMKLDFYMVRIKAFDKF